MKNLENKIFAGALALATLGIFGEKNLMAQNAKENSIKYPDSLCIEVNNENFGERNQMKHALGYYNGKWVAFVGCNYYKNGKYTNRSIHPGGRSDINEEFTIDYNTGLIDYRIYHINPYKGVIDFKNLTKNQIYQEEEFAERTKRIINACESDEKLREIVKEVFKEGIGNIPDIEQ